jgi:taurine dioxygenase
VVHVEPLSGYTGAELSGVDLRALDDAEVAAIRAALVTWKVVFFRDQELTRAEHVALARRFGEPTPAHPTLPAAFPDHPEVLLLDNALGGEAPNIESRWHTDVTFLPAPPMGSILRGVVVPDHGGDTQWTNLVAAYEALSAPLQQLCDGLHALHRNFLPPIRGDEASAFAGSFMARPIRAVHPVVRVHPESGERALFVNPNFTSHVVELTNREGAHLLALLYEHITDPRFTVRFRWRPGSVAFWDNRATAHLVPTDVRGERRAMERVTIAGDIPVGPDGSRSHAVEAPA